MNALNESEMSEINGGGVGIPFIGVYMAFLDKVEKNPQDYTWMMDWYYAQP
jgi:hypothetical protein